MAVARRPTARTKLTETWAKPLFEHVFTGKLVELLIGGTMRYWVLFLPASLQRKPPFAAKKKLRMRGVVGGVHGRPVSMAWQLSGGRHYLMFGKATAKSLALKLGGKVEVAFSVVDDDVVDLPEELAEALTQEPEWSKLWAALTPGRRRGIAHLVRMIISPDLRAQRAVELVRALEEGTLQSFIGRARPSARDR